SRSARSPGAAPPCARPGSSPTACWRWWSTPPPTTRSRTSSSPPYARSDPRPRQTSASMSSPAARAADARPDARPSDQSSTPAVPSRDGGRPARPRRRGRRRPRPGAAGEGVPVPTGEVRPVDDAELDALAERIPALSLQDEHRLGRRLETVRRTRNAVARARAAAGLVAEVEAAERRMEARRSAELTIRYPESLPVSARHDDIAAAIRDHQVVIVAGETGSGKTTQLPKICLELGRGRRGLIGHTQPRRLAARTVATRIAEELGTELGDIVGWKVRFTDHVGERTLVKQMTDGILLAELAGDKMLRQYDTLIIDEAHERSLNIDFILGYLTQLLPRRPDLKVIITSATIDVERFAEHFKAPVVEVSGRSYPVEIRYRPVVDLDAPDHDPDRDQLDAIGDAVAELQREGDGDILVFLPGEREIREAAEALARRDFRNTEILPLYARLSTAEQHR